MVNPQALSVDTTTFHGNTPGIISRDQALLLAVILSLVLLSCVIVYYHINWKYSAQDSYLT